MKEYLVTKRKFISTIIGVIYEMAPGNRPRNIDKINDYLIKWANENIGDKFLIRVKDENLKKFFNDILFNCVEFTQLNISQKLWDSGIRDYNDKRNSGIGIVAVDHDESGNPTTILTSKEYYDFIDIWAAIQNITYKFKVTEEINEDCFLCKHADEYKSMKPSDSFTCNTCILNPSYKCNYEVHPEALIPQNQKQNKDE